MRVNRSTKPEGPGMAGTVGIAHRARPEVQKLIEALREELSEYGVMLVLLDQQQKLIMARRATDLLDNAGAMSVQIQILTGIRAVRQRLGRELAVALGQPEDSLSRHLIALAPCECQPLLTALVDEINRILFHCQQRLLQNKLLLGPSPSDQVSSPNRKGLVYFGLN